MAIYRCLQGLDLFEPHLIDSKDHKRKVLGHSEPLEGGPGEAGARTLDPGDQTGLVSSKLKWRVALKQGNLAVLGLLGQGRDLRGALGTC